MSRIINEYQFIFLSKFVCLLGFHFIPMKEFLAREAATGGLHPERAKLPGGDTNISGPKLWNYLNKVADETPGNSIFLLVYVSRNYCSFTNALMYNAYI